MKKLFYYFLIATLAFNFVGCSDKDKDLDDVIDELDNGSEDDEDWETVEIGDCTYDIYPKIQKAKLSLGHKVSAGYYSNNFPKVAVKGDFVVPQTITYKSKTYTVTRVEQTAFTLCNDVTSLTFSDNIEYIGRNQIPIKQASDNNSSFKLTIGKGIKTIGSQAVKKNTIFIIYATTPPEITSDMNTDYYNEKDMFQTVLRAQKPKLYVSKESIEAYKEHDVWGGCDIHSIDELEE